MTVLFWISLDQICPNWIKLDQIGSITNQKGPGAILTQFLCLCLPKRHTALLHWSAVQLFCSASLCRSTYYDKLAHRQQFCTCITHHTVILEYFNIKNKHSLILPSSLFIYIGTQDNFFFNSCEGLMRADLTRPFWKIAKMALFYSSMKFLC